MIKAYFEILPGKPLLPVVYFYGMDNEKYLKNVPFIKKTLSEITGKFVERVDSALLSDVIIIPHAWEYIKHEKDYLHRVRATATETNKHILLFSFEDFFELPDWPEVIAFCPTGYRSELPANQIPMPYLVQDFSFERNVTARSLPTIPVIGFVGWGRFDTWKQWLRSHLKDIVVVLKNIVLRKKSIGMRRKGLLLRVKLLRELAKNVTIKTNFIIRDNYGGSAKVVSPEALMQGREEFITNVIESDAILAPRGEGNSSQRFYEALSLGRFPILIDTDVPLPLSDIVDYDHFMIRVPYQDRLKVADYVVRFFAGLDETTYLQRQREAQRIFTTYLSVNGFNTYMFTEEHLWDYISKS